MEFWISSKLAQKVGDHIMRLKNATRGSKFKESEIEVCAKSYSGSAVVMLTRLCIRTRAVTGRCDCMSLSQVRQGMDLRGKKRAGMDSVPALRRRGISDLGTN